MFSGLQKSNHITISRVHGQYRTQGFHQFKRNQSDVAIGLNSGESCNLIGVTKFFISVIFGFTEFFVTVHVFAEVVSENGKIPQNSFHFVNNINFQSTFSKSF